MMQKPKLFLDTNTIIDYLDEREPFYEGARLLMICGRLAELELWMTGSQATDLVYILSEGGKPSRIARVLSRLRALRAFVNVWPTGPNEVDATLSATWDDPEDALVYDSALRLGADAIITRDKKGFEQSNLPVMDCDELFQWLEDEFDLTYGEIAF